MSKSEFDEQLETVARIIADYREGRIPPLQGRRVSLGGIHSGYSQTF